MVIIDHRIVDLDKQKRQKVIYVRPEQRQQQSNSQPDKNKEQYPGRDVIIIGSPEENQRRIAELDRSIRLETQRREQLDRRQHTIDCWVDKNGKKIYTNMPQENRGMKRCE